MFHPSLFSGLRDLLELHASLLRGLFGLGWLFCLLFGFGVFAGVFLRFRILARNSLLTSTR